MQQKQMTMQQHKDMRKKVLVMAIAIKPSHKGLLHKKLGVPAGEKIPAKKLAEAKHSKSAALRKEANFAENAKDWHKGNK